MARTPLWGSDVGSDIPAARSHAPASFAFADVLTCEEGATSASVTRPAGQ
ncbi:hypothetical protein GCM10009727_67910 [Actinomadura napierensis]|uniref:Uncharacterized protein n=1 Tax=Actinomadura napierensis TaxID=267854 RepID=A0ABP5M018_9ACTN